MTQTARSSHTHARTYLDLKQTPELLCGCLVDVRARRHLPLPRELSEPKVVELPLKRSELGVGVLQRRGAMCETLGPKRFLKSRRHKDA
jgi:hypothetical protein